MSAQHEQMARQPKARTAKQDKREYSKVRRRQERKLLDDAPKKNRYRGYTS